MARDINISIIAKDNYSQAVKTMRDTTQKFNKDLDAMKSKIDAVSKTKITIKTDTTKAREELKRLQEIMAETRKAGAELSTSMDSLNSIDITKGIGSSLKKQFGGMVLSTITNAATTYGNSALGEKNGNVLSNAISMGVTGAMLGSVIPVFGNVAGAVIGGAIGIGLGVINGSIENFADKDEAFKSYISNQYEGIVQERSNMVTNASSLAASQEDSENAKAFNEATNTLIELKNNKAIDAGDAYNNARLGNKSDVNDGDLADQIVFYSGEVGTALGEVDIAYAELQAQLQNKQNQYNMEVEDALVNGTVLSDDYSSETKERVEAMHEEFGKLDMNVPADVAKKKALVEEAHAIAANEFSGDELVQQIQDSDAELISNLQDSAEANNAGWTNVMEIKDLLSQGLAAAGYDKKTETQYRKAPIDDTPIKWVKSNGLLPTEEDLTNYKENISAHAYGLGYVPYNNFPALLHEGERVLTASENRGYGSGSGVTITGNNFTVREEADINKIARALFGEIEKARMVMAS